MLLFCIGMGRKKNTWFQFKQFRIEQEGLGMKVTTDACLFGAWLPVGAEQRILDIGTGSGLLALMLAQRSLATTQLDGVELNARAAQLAQVNFSQSPWGKRLRSYHQAIQSFEAEATYDLIVCNPPFFKKHKSSGDLERDQAMLQDYLEFEELVVAIDRWLSPKGACYLLLPPFEARQLKAMLQTAGLYCTRWVDVANEEGKGPFRVMAGYQRQKQPEETSSLCIYVGPGAGAYTTAYSDLLRPYYLYL